MNLRKIKSLPFNMWGIWNLFDGDIEPKEMFIEFTEIPAIIGKPGRYYDRESKVCWTELPNGKSYKVNSDMFLYELNLARSIERPLTDYEREAIRTLLVYNNGPTGRYLSDRLHQDTNARMLRNTKRMSMLARLSHGHA